MKTLLVPFDFSEHAAYALDFAKQLSRKMDARIQLLHVIEFPTLAYSFTEESNKTSLEIFYGKDYPKEVEDKLRKVAEASEKEGFETSFSIKQGNPFQNISKAIAEEKASYIVMGSKGVSGLREIFIGSNAERVIRHADCPVFVVKGPVKIDEMRNLVFASDLSEEQDWIVLKVKEIQQLFDLNLHIVKVITPHNLLTSDAADEQFDAFFERNQFENYSKNTIHSDYPDEGIIEFAENIGSGLIILGTHGKTGLAHIFGGSRAEDLANESKLPVLTFKLPD
jgi:nucleotide-binding universal stress UspA family protein